MLMEAIVNDYIHTRKVKGDFSSFPLEFDYWTNALTGPPVVIYIYVRPPVPRNDTRFPAVEAVANALFGGLRDDIREGFTKTVLQAFRAAGYDCERHDALVAIAAGY